MKWATFAKVNGVWRFEGFVEEGRLVGMARECEAENGPASFRAHIFVDDKEKEL